MEIIVSVHALPKSAPHIIYRWDHTVTRYLKDGTILRPRVLTDQQRGSIQRVRPEFPVILVFDAIFPPTIDQAWIDKKQCVEEFLRQELGGLVTATFASHRHWHDTYGI
jgi:hypothetical protein